MAITPKRGSFVHLEDVRVFYDRKADRISLTSGDRDLPEAGGLKIDLSPGSQSELQLRELLKSQGVIEEAIWPKISREDTLRLIHGSSESLIHLGTTIEGESFEWSWGSCSNLWSHGAPGAGASNFARLLAEHGLNHGWEIYGFDPKLSMVPFGGRSERVELIHDSEQMVPVIAALYDRLLSGGRDRLQPDGRVRTTLLLLDDLEAMLGGMAEESHRLLFLDTLGDLLRLSKPSGVVVQLNSEWPVGLSPAVTAKLAKLWPLFSHCFVGNYPVDRIPLQFRSGYFPGRGRGRGRAQLQGTEFQIGSLEHRENRW